MKRIVLLLAVTAVVVTMLAVGAGTAFAGVKGKGDGVGGGDIANSKDLKAEKTRTGGGPINNPHVNPF